METIIFIFYILYGLAIGSFLNVVIYRLPLNLPIAKGRSMCPKCKTTLTASDLIPVFSFLFLKRKCKYCNEPISYIYPVVELLTAFLFGICFLIFGLTIQSVIMCIFMCVIIVAAFIDLEHKYIPDRLSFIIILLSIISIFTCSQISLSSRLSGSLVVSGTMFVISYITKGGIGGGDIKLFFSTGLLLGFKVNVLAFLLGYLVAALYLIIPLIKKKIPKGFEVPMAPFFGISIIFSSLYGERFIAWYLALMM